MLLQTKHGRIVQGGSHGTRHRVRRERPTITDCFQQQPTICRPADKGRIQEVSNTFIYWLNVTVFTSPAVGCKLLRYTFTRISEKRHIQTSRNFLYTLLVVEARFFCDDNAIRYVLPVLWMTSYLSIIGHTALD